MSTTINISDDKEKEMDRETSAVLKERVAKSTCGGYDGRNVSFVLWLFDRASGIVSKETMQRYISAERYRRGYTAGDIAASPETCRRRYTVVYFRHVSCGISPRTYRRRYHGIAGDIPPEMYRGIFPVVHLRGDISRYRLRRDDAATSPAAHRRRCISVEIYRGIVSVENMLRCMPPHISAETMPRYISGGVSEILRHRRRYTAGDILWYISGRDFRRCVSPTVCLRRDIPRHRLCGDAPRCHLRGDYAEVRLRGDDTAVRLREDNAPAFEDAASVDDGVLVHVAAPVDDNVLVYASPVLSTAVELELSSSCISQHQQLLGSILASLRAEAQHPRSVRERWTCARNRWPWTVAPCRCGKDRFDGSVRSRLGLMVFFCFVF